MPTNDLLPSAGTVATTAIGAGSATLTMQSGWVGQSHIYIGLFIALCTAAFVFIRALNTWYEFRSNWIIRRRSEQAQVDKALREFDDYDEFQKWKHNKGVKNEKANSD